MKKQFKFILSAVILIFCCYSCKNEKLAVAGSGWQEIAIIEKNSGLIEWRHQLEEGDECNDVEVTPDGNVLFAYSKGAKLINRNHEVIWDYKANENEEVHTASRLKDGNFMIAVCGDPEARIVELDKDGKQTKEITFPTLIFDTHRQFRQVTKKNDGMYLVPLINKRKILQITPEGRFKGSVYIGHDVFSVKALDNGNLLVSCGRDNMFVEINPASQQDSTFITNRVQGASLLYVAEIFQYKNGNRMIANSNMYSDDKSQPLLIEINENNDVVWALPFNKEIKNITAVYSFSE
ncbi:MAG: hypothetical protein LBC19_17040 [Tannerella sp.]|nr:hypothetical protein [Tannerella sp.]